MSWLLLCNSNSTRQHLSFNFVVLVFFWGGAVVYCDCLETDSRLGERLIVQSIVHTVANVIIEDQNRI